MQRRCRRIHPHIRTDAFRYHQFLQGIALSVSLRRSALPSVLSKSSDLPSYGVYETSLFQLGEEALLLSSSNFPSLPLPVLFRLGQFPEVARRDPSPGGQSSTLGNAKKSLLSCTVVTDIFLWARNVFEHCRQIQFDSKSRQLQRLAAKRSRPFYQ